LKFRAAERGKISWTGRVRDEVSQRGTEERNILQTIKRKKANFNGHLLGTNCILKHITEGKIEERIEATERRRRRKKLLDNLKETRSYCKLKEGALDRIVRKTRFGRGYFS
jgi:hypothetical protein